MNEKQKDIVEKTKIYVRSKFEGEATGHDWWHLQRVFDMATFLAKKEKANLFIVQLAALLHDISDYKFNGGDEKMGGKITREWLISLGVDDKDILEVSDIVDNISFKGLKENNKIKNKEGFVVQDADRLDAIGAIGIARCFAYGGSKKVPIYNPHNKENSEKDFSEYKKGSSSQIQHFEDKLLHLKDLMNTKSGKKIAKNRHKYLVGFVKEFFEEWNGKK